MPRCAHGNFKGEGPQKRVPKFPSILRHIMWICLVRLFPLSQSY